MAAQAEKHGLALKIVPYSCMESLKLDFEAFSKRDDLNGFQRYILSERYMLDPTYRLILSGEDGVPLNLSEPRRALIDEKPLKPNPEANYNGTPFDLEDYLGYIQKNTFRFQRSEKAYCGCEDWRDGNRPLMLVPKDYVAVCGDMDEAEKKSLVTNDKQFWG